MALSLFRSKEPTPPARPARDALHAHLGGTVGIARQIDTLNTRVTAVHTDIKLEDSLTSQVQVARELIDTTVADARYSDARPPDLTEAKHRLAELEAELAQAEPHARAARLVLPRLQAEVAALGQQRADLKPETDRLLWEALTEEGVVLREEYQSAMDAMRNMAHRVFSAFAAADKVSRSRGYGVFSGGDLYANLFIPLPTHAAYQTPSLTPEAAQAVRYADFAAVHTEADALINEMLTGAKES